MGFLDSLRDRFAGNAGDDDDYYEDDYYEDAEASSRAPENVRRAASASSRGAMAMRPSRRMPGSAASACS